MQGVVREVHFAADPNGNIPRMTASVNVTSVGGGALAGSTIFVRQPRGASGSAER